MKRLGMILWILLFLLVVTISRTGFAANVQGTKHDLSAQAPFGTGPGPIRADVSSFVSEICVFCHTPHGAAAASAGAPLWNKIVDPTSDPGYVVYSSDVLSKLGISADKPLTSIRGVHLKTRLCLSCHDGTIALGQLANLPNPLSSDILMVGTTGTTDVPYAMPHEKGGYIGKNLRDDHPVAIPLDTVKDPELKGGPYGKVRIYPESGNNYVECTSCHEPHDDTYGNFLVDSNLNSKICTTCHSKETDQAVSPAHDNSGASYNPDGSGSIGTTVGGLITGVMCMNCHYPHKAGISPGASLPNPDPEFGKYLLSFQEEQTCFNNPNRWGNAVSSCHGNGMVATKAIQPLVNGTKASAHRVGTYGIYSGRHKATEADAFNWLSTTQWHVVCEDCHNSHSAGAGIRLPGGPFGNVINPDSPLYGTGGVAISSWPAAWSPLQLTNVTPFESLGVTTSTTMPANYYEYQICLKCHSSFAWNLGPIPTPPFNMTDQAMEFNTNNQSYHPVVQPNPFRYVLPPASFTGGSGFAGGDTMYCSDCHGNKTAGEAQGPHGSNASPGYILVRDFDDTYFTPAGVAGTQLSSDLCFKCHEPTVYRDGLATQTGTGFMTTANTNLHTQHKLKAEAGVGTYSYRCVNCHTRIPHGYDANKAMIVTGADGALVTTYGAAGTALITNATLPASLTYGTTPPTSGCSTVAGCH